MSNDLDDWDKPRSRGTHLSDAEIELVKRAYRDERKIRDVARELKCASRTVSKYYGFFREEGVRTKSTPAKPVRGPRYYTSNFEPN